MKRKIYWWIASLIILLVAFTTFVYLNTQSDNRQYEEEIADVNQLLENRKKPTTKQPNNQSDAELIQTPDDDIEQHADKTFTEISVTNDIEPTQEKNKVATPVETVEIETDVKVSLYGFGPYPEVPEDMPNRHLYTSWDDESYMGELLSRVLIKLWKSGERNFIGGSTKYGKIYPHYFNTVYVKRKLYRDSDGNVTGHFTQKLSGPFVNYTEADILDPPPHLRVLDLESSGIDPYQYLDLPYQKGEK